MGGLLLFVVLTGLLAAGHRLIRAGHRLARRLRSSSRRRVALEWAADRRWLRTLRAVPEPGDPWDSGPIPIRPGAHREQAPASAGGAA